MLVVEWRDGAIAEVEEGCEKRGSVQVMHLQSASFYFAVEIVVAEPGSGTVLVLFDRTVT